MAINDILLREGEVVERKNGGVKKLWVIYEEKMQA